MHKGSTALPSHVCPLPCPAAASAPREKHQLRRARRDWELAQHGRRCPRFFVFCYQKQSRKKAEWGWQFGRTWSQRLGVCLYHWEGTPYWGGKRPPPNLKAHWTKVWANCLQKGKIKALLELQHEPSLVPPGVVPDRLVPTWMFCLGRSEFFSSTWTSISTKWIGLLLLQLISAL